MLEFVTFFHAGTGFKASDQVERDLAPEISECHRADETGNFIREGSEIAGFADLPRVFG